jgi:hypothetical protein
MAIGFNGAVPTASLPANASLHELKISTPDVGTMRLVWAGWALLAVLAILMVIIIIAAAMKRRSALNDYMAAMVLPDGVANTIMIVTCALGSAQGRYPGAFLCQLQCSTLAIQICLSSWLNLCIGVEVYKILSSTRALATYKPPSRKTVWMVCCAVFVFCGICASLPSIDVVPISPRPLRGLVCFPAADNDVIYHDFIMFGPGVILPGALTAGLIFSAFRKGLVDWDLIIPKRLLLAPSKGAGATPPSLQKALGDAAYQRGRAQARSVVLFFLRVMNTMVVWLVATLLSLYTYDVGPVFICVSLGRSLTFDAASPSSDALERGTLAPPALPVSPQYFFIRSLIADHSHSAQRTHIIKAQDPPRGAHTPSTGITNTNT